MSEIANRFLLTCDKFMPKMQFRNACGPFIKNKERIQNYKETGDSIYIYQNKLDQACFQHDMAHGDFKNMSRKAACPKILHVTACNIGKNPKYLQYQRGLASAVYKCLDKKSSGAAVKNESLRIKVHLSFIDNIWGANLAGMQLITKS